MTTIDELEDYAPEGYTAPKAVKLRRETDCRCDENQGKQLCFLHRVTPLYEEDGTNATKREEWAFWALLGFFCGVVGLGVWAVVG